MPRLRRFSSLFTPIRKSLLDRSDVVIAADPFGPLDQVRRKLKPVPLPLAAPVGPPGLQTTRNRPADVGRVAGALERAGILGGGSGGGRRPLFDTRLDTGVRDFQRLKRLKVDGLLNPGGPTVRALGRALVRPPLKGLSGEAVAANGRLVKHLMGTTADGMVPGLMVGDFHHGETGRAKSLRAKAGRMMETGEKSLLDELILQGRLADEDPPDGSDDGGEDDDDETPDDPGQDDPEEPGDPEKPEKPKPDCEAEEEAVEAAKEDVDAAEAELTDIQQEVQATKDRVVEVKKEIQGALDGIDQLMGMIAEDNAAIADARKVIEGPWFGRDKSPLYKAAIKDHKRKIRVRDSEIQLKIVEAELKALREELSELNKTLSQLEGRAAEAEKTLEDQKSRLAEAQSALEACQEQ